MLAALRPVLQQALAAHAEHRRDLGVVEERAVVDDAALIVRIAEALLLTQRLERDATDFERCHRVIEPVDPVVLADVLLLEPRALDVEFRHVQRLEPAHVHGVERLAGAVLDHVRAASDGPWLIRIQRNVERHVGDARLRHVLVADQHFLVLRLLALATQRCRVVVHDVGVVVDPAAEPAHRDDGRRCNQPRRTAELARQVRQAGLERRADAATPERVRQDGEQDRRGRPVGAEPPGEASKIALPVHVGQRRAGVARVLVEVVLEAESIEGRLADHEQQHQHPAEGLVRHERLHEDREHREQHHAHGRRQHVPDQILADLELEIALEQLHEDRREHARRQC